MYKYIFLFILFLIPSVVYAADASKVDKGAVWIMLMIEKGGPVMYPIILCSLVGLTLIIERLLTLSERKVLSTKHLDEIRNYWMRNDIEKAVHRCNELDIPLYRIIKAGLLHCRHGIYEIERAIEAAGQHESALLSTNLRMLGALANLTPMLGLLGTVLGMIKAFEVISISGTGNPGLVASGISEALITTATGLIVGIPILLCYHYFKGKVDFFVFEMEEVSLNLIEELIHNKEMI
ncbi:MAG: MotA/TolQ/ExbB proton channel family protein [Nitrospinae bacterium]|nr:MotA/TolQ/ExbB proton channel family protein [Nitrospinota bacterium]